MKILIVEDEEMIRRGIVMTVDWESLHCEIVGEAANGAEGLEKAEQLKPDLIITDLKMPVMNGIELLQELRNRGNQVAVIILTAFDSFEYVRGALRLGAVDYLLKPFHDGDLEQAVLQFREKTGQQESTALPELLPHKEHYSRLVRTTLDYIAQNYGDSTISIGSIAENLGISEGHLSHLFKKETDCTVLSYLTRFRIRKAMELLHDRKRKVYEAAEQTGYNDIAYFSATFKKITGLTPSEYQESIGKNTNEHG